jgi:hypothetical protein
MCLDAAQQREYQRPPHLFAKYCRILSFGFSLTQRVEY